MAKLNHSCEALREYGFFVAYSGTRSNAASHAAELPSDGARQSPRGESEPPEEIFGPLGMAERLYWLVVKKRS